MNRFNLYEATVFVGKQTSHCLFERRRRVHVIVDYIGEVIRINLGYGPKFTIAKVGNELVGFVGGLNPNVRCNQIWLGDIHAYFNDFIHVNLSLSSRRRVEQGAKGNRDDL
jgi:hypothetical protein